MKLVVANSDVFKPTKYAESNGSIAKKEKTVAASEPLKLPRIVPEGRATKLGEANKPKIIL